MHNTTTIDTKEPFQSQQQLFNPHLFSYYENHQQIDVKKESRRQLVSRVLTKLFQDRLFTTTELKETLAPVIESEWEEIYLTHTEIKDLEIRDSKTKWRED